MLAFECARRGTDPQAASDFLRSDNAWNRDLADVPGHRDCNATICPGGHVYDHLDELRAGVAEAVANAGPPVSGLTGQAGDPVADGLAEYDWTIDGTSTYQYCLEGWQRLPGSEDIDYLSRSISPGATTRWWRRSDASRAGRGRSSASRSHLKRGNEQPSGSRQETSKDFLLGRYLEAQQARDELGLANGAKDPGC